MKHGVAMEFSPRVADLRPVHKLFLPLLFCTSNIFQLPTNPAPMTVESSSPLQLVSQELQTLQEVHQVLIKEHEDLHIR